MADVPTLVFIYDIGNWSNKISSLSKVDLLDIVPHIATSFYYDLRISAFIVIISKDKWNEISQTRKTKLMTIVRRLKEEIDGTMTTTEREEFENTDLFLQYMERLANKLRAEAESEMTLKTIDEEIDDVDYVQ